MNLYLELLCASALLGLVSAQYCGPHDGGHDVGSRTTCSCQSGDRGCDCVLGCGCTRTGDDMCSAVNLINKTFTDVVGGAPYKFLAIWFSQENAQIDNICVTYFRQTGADSIVAYYSKVFIDGSNSIGAFILRGGGPGIVLVGDSQNVIKDKTFGEVPGCDANIVFRCFLWGENAYPGNRDFQYPTYAVGPLCATRDSSCGQTAAQAMVNAGYDQKYWVFPENLPYQCVTSQAGYPTANTCNTLNYPCQN